MIYSGQYGLEDLNEVVQRAVADLSEHRFRFDSIAVTGTSGLVVGAPVAVLLGKPLVVVRKRDDKSTHSSTLVENGENAGERVLFLDDFIGTGRTRAHVEEALRTSTSVESGLVGEYMYNSSQSPAYLDWHDKPTNYYAESLRPDGAFPF